MFAKTPKPPYFAVIFTSTRKQSDNGEYGKASEAMVASAKSQPGFLGYESTGSEDGVGITVSYWSDLDSIKNWKANQEHRTAQAKGRSIWYQDYRVRIARVEREYSLADSEFNTEKHSGSASG
jgi:heme-degrading monooxygenase HmoA